MRAEAGGRREQKEIRLQIFARTRNRAANQHIVHYHCVDHHVLKIDHQKAGECVSVYACFYTCIPTYACTCALLYLCVVDFEEERSRLRPL